MVGDALAGQARHASEQVRAKRELGFEVPEEREVDAEARELVEGAAPVGDGAPAPGESASVPFTQRAIDLRRTRILNFLIAQEVAGCMKDFVQRSLLRTPNLSGVKHLWYPEPNVNGYELRNGNPPPDDPRDRPAHLVGKDLVIDLDLITQAMWAQASAKLHRLMKSKYGRNTGWCDAILQLKAIKDSAIELPRA